MDSPSILSATATFMPTHWNTVGKVKNIKLHNFRLVQLIQSLHTAAISLEVTQICIHALLFHVVLWKLTCLTPATNIHLSLASSNRIPQLTFCKQIEVARMAVLSVSAAYRITRIIWHRAVCNCFCRYIRRAWDFANPGLNYTEMTCLGQCVLFSVC